MFSIRGRDYLGTSEFLSGMLMFMWSSGPHILRGTKGLWVLGGLSVWRGLRPHTGNPTP